MDNIGRTPLFFAVEKKHLNVAQLLVKGGANVLVRTAEGKNLLHAAARKGTYCGEVDCGATEFYRTYLNPF